jgi:hypothetical protein
VNYKFDSNEIDKRELQSRKYDDPTISTLCGISIDLKNEYANILDCGTEYGAVQSSMIRQGMSKSVWRAQQERCQKSLLALFTICFDTVLRHASDQRYWLDNRGRLLS